MKSTKPSPRVLSLLSASTEIVHRLGCSHLLVGRSHGCDDPPLAEVLPVTTAPKVDPNACSIALDAAVRAQSAAGGAIYLINGELVKKIRPDVIITQEQCRICAVTPEDVAIACGSSSSGSELPAETVLVTIKPITLDDVYGDVETIAKALGVPERGTRLVQWMQHRFSSLSSLVATTLSTIAPPPHVVHVEWLAPLMGSGYWIAECVEAAGCVMMHGHRGGHSHTLSSVDELAIADVIVIAPCGFSIERTYSEMVEIGLLTSPTWLALPAVIAGRVGIADGNLYFNRSSCGVVETAEIVAEISHDELRGIFGHHGRRWVRLWELEVFCKRENAPSPMKPVVLANNIQNNMRPNLSTYVVPNTMPDKLDPKKTHVRLQIDRLRMNDFAGAFALNSAPNQARIGDLATFETMIKTNTSFAELAKHKNEFIFVDSEDRENTVVVQVHSRDSGQDFVFLFDVSVLNTGLVTDGVRIQC